MKKGCKFFAGVLMGGLLASTVAMAGCGKTPADNRAMQSNTDVYGFASATTGMLMADDGIQGAMLAGSAIQGESALDNLKSQFDSAISQTLDKYMGVFDAVVGEEKPTNSVLSTSEKTEFRHKLTISATSIDGGGFSCVLHFNETKNNGQNEVMNPNEESVNTFLEGELYVNGSEIPLYVKGWKEVDANDNESEFKLEARIIKDSDLNMVKFEQEISNEKGEYEEEYTFELVFGGVSKEFSFELEKNVNGKIEVEYELDFGTSGEIAFEVEKTANDAITIKTNQLTGKELAITVKVEKNASQTQQRYVYTSTLLGLNVSGEWRDL